MTPLSNQMIFCVCLVFHKGKNIKYSCSLKKIKYYSHSKIEHLEGLTIHGDYILNEQFINGYHPQQHIKSMITLKHYINSETDCGKHPIPIIFINEMDKYHFALLILLFGIKKDLHLDSWSDLSDNLIIVEQYKDCFYPKLSNKLCSKLLADLADQMCKSSIKTYKILHKYAAKFDNIVEIDNYFNPNTNDSKSKK